MDYMEEGSSGKLMLCNVVFVLKRRYVAVICT